MFGASVSLSSAVIVTVPVLVVALAAMVSNLLSLKVKSPDTAGRTAAADTVIAVATLDMRFSVAVTVVSLGEPLSSIVAGESTSVTCGVSSSVMVRATLDGLVMP